METKIIDIGNSRGIIIPKKAIESLGLEKGAIMNIGEEEIVIRPLRQPRRGWAEQYEQAGAGNEELLMGDELQNSFDLEEWTWD